MSAIEKDIQGVQICTLWGCEEVQPYYYLIGYNVVNIKTGHVKAINRLNTKRAYPYVTLETVSAGRNKKCLMHHLVALAYIKNEPYDVIEHLDDDAENYSVENLEFSNQSNNIARAFENGRSNRIEKVFEVVMNNGNKFSGTMKALQKQTGIPRQTLYDRCYKGTPGKKIRSVVEIKSTEYRTGTDR